MESRREQALVGLFVLVAAGLLIVTVFLLSGKLGRGDISYRAYFKNAGGLGPGAQVRYAGGPPIGRVEKVQSDSQDPTRMEIDFSVQPDVPIKTDSTATITSTSPLADNFLGIVPGSKSASRAGAGATLKSSEFISFADIAAIISGLGPNANDLITNLDARAVALQETLNRVNDILSTQNRANISSGLQNLRGILDEDRPAIRTAVNNLSDSSRKIGPLMDDFQKTSAQANLALSHLDATISEDRPDIRAALASLRQVLDSANMLTEQLNQTVNANAENLDEILDNLRHVSDNLNAFTETIKTRPYTLIRASGVKPRKPGDAPPK
jgi:phospholipid/cholesterol/gamma-HCH transport system substrate-binding protein